MTFLVAEIGVNWDGNFELAQTMLTKAKQMGFDAVKFQSFNELIIGDHPQKERLLKSSISKQNIEKINELAKSIEIEWFCTPMYPGAIELLDPYVRRYKIRFHDGKAIKNNQRTELFECILNTKKQIIISSQASPKGSKFFGNPNINWLYCVPKYPCDLTDLDFSNLKDFDGYSNHCPNSLALLTAAILGSKIIEIHVTNDKSKDFIDNPVSFEFSKAGEIIKQIHLAEKIKR